MMFCVLPSRELRERIRGPGGKLMPGYKNLGLSSSLLRVADGEIMVVTY